MYLTKLLQWASMKTKVSETKLYDREGGCTVREYI